MADLMKGTKSYQDIAKSYNNFLVPVFKIKSKGKNLLESMNLAVEGLTVVLPLDSAASCNFSIANAYAPKARVFQSKIMDAFKPGTVMEVELGYGSSTVMIFKGYVSTLSESFGESFSLDISLLDVRRLMMDSGKRMMPHQVQSYSDAFVEVMKTYQKICTQLEIDKTPKELDSDGVYQGTNDHKFIMRDLTVKAEREFFVLAGKAYFRKVQKSTAPITTLTWGEGLISFQRSINFVNSIIVVQGFDEEKLQTFEAKAQAKCSDDSTSVISSPQPDINVDPDATSQSKAQTRADYLAKKLLMESQTAIGTCIGIPEIVPGRYIALDKIGRGSGKKYYITKVEHTIGAEGFTTTFTVRGWE